MTNGWQEIPLGEVLTERRETPTPESLENGEVSIVSKIGFNEGKIELRADGKTKTGMILARPGDLVISGINATKGAIAIYPETAQKPIAATIHYGAYIPNKERVDVQYLWWFLRSAAFRDIVQHHIPGGIKTELKSKRFLAVPVPLPSLNEQQRILSHIESLARRVNEAQSLREEADREAKILSLSSRNKAFGEIENSPIKKLGDLSIIVRGSSPRPKGDLRFYGGNVPRLLIADVSRDGKYVTPQIDFLTEDGAKLSRPMVKGSLVIAISGSYGIPAFLAVDACIHDGFIGFRDIDPAIDLEYLYQVLLYSKPYFDSVVKNSGLQNLTTNHLKNLDVPVPPLDEQRRIVAYLDGLQGKVNALRELQSRSGEELSALMPSVLDKAFKGEF